MRRILAAVLLLLPLVALPAVAEICTIDDVPAATLLLPYFEVDLASQNGVQTLFSINNASASAAVARVTVWTAFGSSRSTSKYGSSRVAAGTSSMVQMTALAGIAPTTKARTNVAKAPGTSGRVNARMMYLPC